MDDRKALRELPSGAVMPEGWWKGALENIAEGWLRRVVEARSPLYYSTFWERNTFGPVEGDVHAEWAGYTADAIVRLSHLLPESWIAGEKGPWLERVLASQDADGYLGAYRPEERWRHGFELWSQDRLLQALICEYEHSGEARVLEACARAGRRLAAQFETPEWKGLYARTRSQAGPHQAGHSLNIIHPLIRLGELTGEAAFRELALGIYADYNRASGEYSAARFLGAEKINAHIVTVCEHVSIPAAAWAAGGPREWLDGALRGHELLKRHSMQATGTLSGNEMTYGRGPRKYTEHCGIIEWAISCARLAALTGRAGFADDAERAMLNAYFATRSPDGLAVAYNHAPNQIVAAEWAAPYEDNWDRAQFRAHFSSHHEPRCCNANTSRGFPNHVARAAMAAPDGGLAIVFYGPWRVAARVAGGEARLRVDTEYPYEDEVRIKVQAAPGGVFPLWLRMPAWCRGAQIEVNGKPAEGRAGAGAFYIIDRAWRAGDRVTVKFDVPIALEAFAQSWHSVPGVTVVRGPLTYALPVEEEWVKSAEEPAGETDWNVLPAKGSRWNVALELDVERPERSLRVERAKDLKDVKDSKGASKEKSWGSTGEDAHATTTLVGKGRVLPDWIPDTINGRMQTPGLPAPPLKPAGEPVEVRLVPFALTHIRMSCLPVLGQEKTQRKLYDQGKAAEG